MKLVINGKPRELEGTRTIAELLQEMGLSPKGLAVETNGVLVSARDFERTELSDGDKLELVRLVGGG
jgi:thiamine biosynthesis protein ThiS